MFAWDTATHAGRELFRAPQTRSLPEQLTQIAPTVCGTKLVVPVGYGVYVLDAATGATVWRSGRSHPHQAPVSPLPDGSAFLSLTRSLVVGCWNAETGDRVPLPGELGKYGRCGHVECVTGGSVVLTMSNTDGSVTLWDRASGRAVGRCSPGEPWPRPPAVSPDGSAFVTGPAHGARADRDLWVFDLASLQRRALLKTPAGFPKAAFHPAGRVLAVASGKPAVTFWDTITGRKLKAFAPKIGGVRVVAFAPDGQTWCAAGDGRFAVVDTELE